MNLFQSGSGMALGASYVGCMVFFAAISCLLTLKIRKKFRAVWILHLLWWCGVAVCEVLAALSLQGVFDTGDGYNFMLDVAIILECMFLPGALANGITAGILRTCRRKAGEK